MKTFLFMAAAASALIITGVVEAQPGPRGEGRGEGGPGRGAMAIMMLGAADYNGDNTVTRAEVEQLRTEEFNWRDRNGDGFLDRADASPTRQRMAELRGDDERPRRGRRGMARLDANDDQRISLEEFVSGQGRMFERLDTNGDDAISPDELDAALEARQARRDARYWWRD
jgi:Ca2+-binding EF-hand superfamily protein